MPPIERRCRQNPKNPPLNKSRSDIRREFANPATFVFLEFTYYTFILGGNTFLSMQAFTRLEESSLVFDLVGLGCIRLDQYNLQGLMTELDESSSSTDDERFCSHMMESRENPSGLEKVCLPIRRSLPRRLIRAWVMNCNPHGQTAKGYLE